MTIFLTLLKNDLKLCIRDLKALLILMVSPFLFIGFFTYALSPYLNKSSFLEPFSIAVVDNENTAQTRIVVRQLDEISIFDEVLNVNEEYARELIGRNEIAAAIVIPPGFSESIVVGENKPVTVIGNKSMPLQSFVVKNLIQSAANLVSAGQSAINTIYHYNQMAGLKGEELEKQFNESTMKIVLEALGRDKMFSDIEILPHLNLTPMEYFTAALIVVFLMFAGMPAMKMLVTERCYGLTKRLNATAVRTWHIVLSKFLVSLFLSIIQFSIIIALTSAVFKNYWGAPAKNIFMLFGAVIFAVSAWSIFVSSLSKTPAASDAVGYLGILLMSVIGGSIYPLSSMPKIIRNLSKLTINRWAMEGFMALFSGDDAIDILIYVYPLLIIGVVFLMLSAGVMRVFKRWDGGN